MRCTSRRRAAWRLGHNRMDLNGSSRSPESEPTRPRRLLYIRKRGEGERAVRATFADALIMRPAVMFGPGDSLLNTILALLRKIPVLPMFGRGLTRLQPVYVGDVTQAIARVLERTERRAVTFELGGPHIDSYEELLRAVAGEAGIEARLVSMPFDVWQHGWRKYPRTLP
jgi:uncharacterized protein YbjT (DUF2867 family)